MPTLLEVAVAARCEKGNSATAREREQAGSVELYTLVVTARLSTTRMSTARLSTTRKSTARLSTTVLQDECNLSTARLSTACQSTASERSIQKTPLHLHLNSYM